MRTTPVAVSCFTGIRGLDLGFEERGWTFDGNIEINQHAQDLLRRRAPLTPLMGDIRDVRATDFTRTPDLLLGGFPCNDTSLGKGQRAGLTGSRSGLFYEQMRLVDEFGRLVDELERPEWVLIENPEGVLSSRGGQDWSAATDALAQRGYGWAYRVVDGRYLGTPQHRPRILLVGHRSGDPRLAAAVLGLYDDGAEAGPSRREQQSRREGRPRPPVADSAAGTLDDGAVIFRKSARARAALDKGGYETWVPAEYANTLTGFDSGGPARQTHLIVYPDGRVRTWTITEWERLCGFEDDWTAGAPDSARFTMLGNCVHRGLGDWIADRLTTVGAQLVAA